MFTGEVTVPFKLYELDLLAKVLHAHVDELQKLIELSKEGKVSLMEEVDCESEEDAEFLLGSYQKIAGVLCAAQQRNQRNDVVFVDQASLFRPEQEVELFRIIGMRAGIDQVVYVLKARHGYYLVYETLESLVESFLKGRESELRFETYVEVELFLSYWRPRLRDE